MEAKRKSAEHPEPYIVKFSVLHAGRFENGWLGKLVVYIVEQVEKRIMLDKLRTSLALLSEEELQMLISLFYLEMTERDLAREYQISQVAIHMRKQRILEKLKKLLEN